jgi:hypothetical protein
VPPPALLGTLLLPEHHRPRHVLPGREQPLVEQGPWLGSCEEHRRPWAGEPEHQPVHGADAAGSSGCVRLVPGAAHVPGAALSHHQRVPEPHLRPLRLCAPPAPFWQGHPPEPARLLKILQVGTRRLWRCDEALLWGMLCSCVLSSRNFGWRCNQVNRVMCGRYGVCVSLNVLFTLRR